MIRTTSVIINSSKFQNVKNIKITIHGINLGFESSVATIVNVVYHDMECNGHMAAYCLWPHSRTGGLLTWRSKPFLRDLLVKSLKGSAGHCHGHFSNGARIPIHIASPS